MVKVQKSTIRQSTGLIALGVTLLCTVPLMSSAVEAETRTDAHGAHQDMEDHIPSHAEIVAMIPVIETVNECHSSGEPVHSEETVDAATGREHIRLMVCESALEDDIRAEAYADAREDLRDARDEVARASEVTENIRAEILAQLDREISRLSAVTP